jgi:hypothetical protein
VILDRALNEDRTVVSHDTDFGTLLAIRRLSKPSFILIRSADPLAFRATTIGQRRKAVTAARRWCRGRCHGARYAVALYRLHVWPIDPPDFSG